MRKFNRINRIRKRITSVFRKNLPEIPVAFIDRPEEVKWVLLIRPNHRLGNQLMVTPLLKETTTTFPNAKIDLLSYTYKSRILAPINIDNGNI